MIQAVRAPAPRPSKLDAYKPYLQERAAQARPQRIPATVLVREIRARSYTGDITQLRAWLAPLECPRYTEPVVRFETAPGEQMQAHFTWIRKARDPLVAFVATLGYSRASFVRFT